MALLLASISRFRRTNRDDDDLLSGSSTIVLTFGRFRSILYGIIELVIQLIHMGYESSQSIPVLLQSSHGGLAFSLWNPESDDTHALSKEILVQDFEAFIQGCCQKALGGM